MSKILIIEDDPDLGMILSRYLAKKGFENELATSGRSGIEKFKEKGPDLLLTDFKLGDMDATDVIIAFRALYPYTPVVVMTGYADIQTAVHVMKIGASDYITKPIIPNDLLVRIQEILENGAHVGSVQNMAPKDHSPKYTPKTLSSKYIMGDSQSSIELYRMIDMVAPTDYSVIIYGESGVGKESVANMIHTKSKRTEKPFVAIDCGALPKDLAGSELFGYEKGAFTGALQAKAGFFEVANGGTLFLDEIGNLPYDVQVSLLRTVQERKVKRIGGSKDIEVDIRIIVASNENLKEAATKGKFREDLYHRFNEFSITVPPLRDRGTDILKMAKSFLKNASVELDKEVTGFTTEVLDIFGEYPWYGNVRELKNIVRRAVLLSHHNVIDVSALPEEIVLWKSASARKITDTLHNPTVALDQPMSNEANHQSIPEHTDLKSMAQSTEYKMIIQALKQSSFNKSKTAKLLNIDRKTLYNKMKLYNIN